MKKIFNKIMNNKQMYIQKFVILLLGAIISLLLTLYIDVKYPTNYDIQRFILLLSGTEYICLHFIINLKRMYNYIYNKRYLIGFCLLFILVLFKINGTSSELWGNSVQPSYTVDSTILLGKNRAIRSDEWLVSTPTTLSQAASSVKFSPISNTLSGGNTKVTFFPNLPSKDISILATPQNIGYFFLDVERAFSLAWYLPYFLLFYGTFELGMILFKKNKLISLAGAFLVTFSPVVQWWQNPSMIAYGSIACVLFYCFCQVGDWKKKLLFSVLFGYSGFLYIMCMYPAWQVPYGYVFAVILIWILIQNLSKLKWKHLFYLIPVLLVIAIPLAIIISSNLDVLKIETSTVYPGARFSTGGGEWRLLFAYPFQIYYVFKDFFNPCEFSCYISLFPIPMIYSIYVMIKNKKIDLFLLLSTIVELCLTIWVIFPLPSIISRITLLYMSTETRCQVAIGYVSILQMLYELSHFEKEDRLCKKNIIYGLVLIVVAVVSSILVVRICNSLISDYMPSYITFIRTLFSIIVFSVLIMLFMWNYKKTNYIFVICVILVSLECGGIVSPIRFGLNTYYEKPLAKEIQKLVQEDENSLYITTDSGIILSNYLVVNGAKVLNTVNYIPNLDIYHFLDTENKYEDIYNRYEHVSVVLTSKETSFDLLQADAININLNYDDICKLSIDYLVTYADYGNKYEKIYDEYGTRIYKTNCGD